MLSFGINLMRRRMLTKPRSNENESWCRLQDQIQFDRLLTLIKIWNKLDASWQELAVSLHNSHSRAWLYQFSTRSQICLAPYRKIFISRLIICDLIQLIISWSLYEQRVNKGPDYNHTSKIMWIESLVKASCPYTKFSKSFVM